MSTEGFGQCTAADLRKLDRAWAALETAEKKRVERRNELAVVMKDLMGKKATRKAIAERVDVDPQTVTFLVNGRPTRAQLRERAKRNGHGTKKSARAGAR